MGLTIPKNNDISRYIPKNNDTSQHKSVVVIGLGESIPFLSSSIARDLKGLKDDVDD